MNARASILAALCALAACSAPETGDARVSVAISALTALDIAQVTVTVTAPDITAPLQANLAQVGATWQGTIDQIPVGSGRRFSAEARTASNVLFLRGEATNVVIHPNATASVMIVLHEVSPPDPFNNSTPYITAIWLSATDLVAQETIDIGADATDPDGDPLTFHWTAPAGSFAAPDQASTTWQAPATTGMYPLTITVADPHAASDTVTATVDVSTSASDGAADVEVAFAFAPRIARISTTRGRIRPGGPAATVRAIASDPDGGPLTYAWTSSCSGTLGNAGSAMTTFTTDDLVATSCLLDVVVTDTTSQATHGTLTLTIGPDPTPDFPPAVDQTSASESTVTHGGAVVFHIEAHDPESSPLTFVWSSPVGTLSAASSTSTTSDVTWTAPACFTGTADVHAQISDAGGHSIEHVFLVQAVSSICAPAGVLAWWTGDDSADAVGGRTLSTTFGSVTHPAGYRGLALGFDGSTQLTASSLGLPFGTAARTIELWVRIDAELSNEDFFVGYGQSGAFDAYYSLGAYTYQPFMSNWGGAIVSGSTISAATWHHLASTTEGGVSKLYVDGILRGTATFTVATNAGAVSFGYLDGSRRLVGGLDEIRIWDRALTATEITQIAAAP